MAEKQQPIPRTKFKSETHEIVYQVRLDRSGVVPLKWLDKPAKEYVVWHDDDGSILLRPIGDKAYVVKATDDDVLYLKDTGAGVGSLEVHHRADGMIALRSANGWHYTDEARPGAPDEVVISHTMTTTDGPWAGIAQKACTPWKTRFIHDGWDRTHDGLDKVPRELNEQRLFADSVRIHGSTEKAAEVHALWEAQAEKRRQYQRARRAAKKATRA